MDIKILAFDLGNVIFNFDLRKFVKSFSAKTPGLREEDFNELLIRYSGEADLFERGKISPEDFYDSLAKRSQYGGSYEEFCIAWNNIFEPAAGTFELLPRLAEKYPLVMLSNTNVLHFEFLYERYPAMFMIFKKFYLSYKMGLRKPEKEIFDALIKDCGAKPGEIFFADDIAENVLSAQKSGMRVLRFENALDLQKRLLSLGVKI